MPTKVCLVKAMAFQVVIYGCESWTIKKAECWRIDAFELWCWRRLLRVLWTARRSSQSILKEISPEYSLEGLMLKWKLQYFGHLTQRADSFEKPLIQGKIEGRRRRGWQRMRWLEVRWHHQVNGHEFEQGPEVGDGQGGLVCCRPWGREESRHDWATELNWTEQSTRSLVYVKHHASHYNHSHFIDEETEASWGCPKLSIVKVEPGLNPGLEISQSPILSRYHTLQEIPDGIPWMIFSLGTLMVTGW